MWFFNWLFGNTDNSCQNEMADFDKITADESKIKSTIKLGKIEIPPSEEELRKSEFAPPTNMMADYQPPLNYNKNDDFFLEESTRIYKTADIFTAEEKAELKHHQYDAHNMMLNPYSMKNMKPSLPPEFSKNNNEYQR